MAYLPASDGELFLALLTLCGLIIFQPGVALSHTDTLQVSLTATPSKGYQLSLRHCLTLSALFTSLKSSIFSLDLRESSDISGILRREGGREREVLGMQCSAGLTG